MTKTRKKYSSDLSPLQEELIKDFLPSAKPEGRPRSVGSDSNVVKVAEA